MFRIYSSTTVNKRSASFIHKLLISHRGLHMFCNLEEKGDDRTLRTASRSGSIKLGIFAFAKGIGIILVILTHTFAHLDLEQSTSLCLIKMLVDCTKAGLMPMFFVISGFGLIKRAPGKMLKKTFSELVIPYLWVMAAYAVIFPLTYCYSAYNGQWEPTIDRTLQYLVAFVLGIGANGTVVFGHETAWCTAAWFFLALFVALNVLNLILRNKNTAVQIACVILCLILGAVLFHFNFFFYCIPQGLMAVGYCYVGYTLKRYRLLDQLQSCKWIYLILLPIFFAELIGGYFDLCRGQFRNVFLDYLGAGCSGILLMLLGIHFGKPEWKGLNRINQLGLYTYWIFAIHAVEMEALPWWYWEKKWTRNPWAALVLELAIKSLIFFICCTLLKANIKHQYSRKTAKEKHK